VDVVALILWVLTAGGGFVLLATWIAKGGARRGGAGSRFPVPLIFGHFLLAAVGLVLWIIYVAADSDGIGWTAFVLLLIVALMGFTMLARWIPTFQANRAAGAAAPEADAGPAERHFPVAIVAGHGLLAATTLVLVLLTMVGVGGS
jgi:manganese efflux pump family protein